VNRIARTHSRALLCAGIFAALALAIITGPASASVHRQCGSVTVSLGGNGDFEGSAYRIVATRVSCRRARRVAGACVRDSLRGWQVFSTADERRAGHDRTVLERADARVSFEVVGGGGCYRP
jgi:hypothetical protein